MKNISENKKRIRTLLLFIILSLATQVNSELFHKLAEVCPEFDISEKTIIDTRSETSEIRAIKSILNSKKKHRNRILANTPKSKPNKSQPSGSQPHPQSQPQPQDVDSHKVIEDLAETSNGLDNESYDSHSKIPEDPKININSRPSLVRQTLVKLIREPTEISSGKLWNQYKVNVSNKYFAGEMLYLFKFPVYEAHTEDYILTQGVQENLYHIVNINNYLMELDQKDLFFRRFNFCNEISRSLILEKQKIGIFNTIPVPEQEEKQILISYEDNFFSLENLIHQMEVGMGGSMMYTEYLKMYKNMALGVKLLHKKFFHCNISINSYTVQSLSEGRAAFFEEEFFEPILLSDNLLLTVKLEKFGDITSKFGKCKDGNLAGRPHEMNYNSLPSSFKHDVYSLAVTILDIEYRYTLKQKPSELLEILMKFFTGPGSELREEYRKRPKIAKKKLNNEDLDAIILEDFKKELKKNLLFNFLVQQLTKESNVEIRETLLKNMKEEGEITEDEYRDAMVGVSGMEKLCLETSVHLISITIREMLGLMLDRVVLKMRFGKREYEIKKMRNLLTVHKRTVVKTVLTAEEKKNLTNALMSVKALDYQSDILTDFYVLLRQAFHYKWAKRIPIVKLVNGIISLQIDLENKLESSREFVEGFGAEEFMALDLNDPAQDLD